MFEEWDSFLESQIAKAKIAFYKHTRFENLKVFFIGSSR